MPTARLELSENSLVVAHHHHGGPERLGRALAQRRLGGRKSAPPQGDDVVAHVGQPGIGQDPARLRRSDAMGLEQLTRQIEPADGGILHQIPEDVGQLERGAEFDREFLGPAAGAAERPNRQQPHRARHPPAVKLEVRHGGSDDSNTDIHFHAVDNGMEIGTPKRVLADRADQRARRRKRRRSIVNAVDLRSPCGKLRQFPVGRVVSIGDVVDLTAEGVDREHRLAPGRWQHPHRPIE